MKLTRFSIVIAAASALCASLSYAQTTNPSTSPSSASSPSQREATHSDSTESPTTTGSDPADASTPSQRDAVNGPKEKMMKDCMTQQAAKNPGMSKSDMTKACHEQMKTHADTSAPK